MKRATQYDNLSRPGQKDTYVMRDKELFPRTTLKGNVIKSIIFVIKSKKKKEKVCDIRVFYF